MTAIKQLVPHLLYLCKCGRALSTCSFLLSRRTGRGVASAFTCKDIVRLNAHVKKSFTRGWYKRFGYDSGVDDIKIMLAAQHPVKCRNLDPKRRERLGVLYKNAIVDLIDESEDLAKLEIVITKVEVLATFLEIRVHWLAKADGNDEVSSQLESCRSSLRRSLSEQFGNSFFPAIKFVMDDKHLIEEKMERLFREADYGMQYRLVSHTAEILGSVPDRGGEKKLPWLEKKRKKQNESEKA
uniref:ATP synthase-coupling factor 6, mitochondrial n=1 Tax=Syphacia muris TaxID=451379 RepID=A0A0N5AB77_9BILA